MSQMITRNEVEDLCEQELQSKFCALMQDLIRFADHAERTRDGAGVARNGRGGAEPQAGIEAALACAEVLLVRDRAARSGGP